ncbi:hypothetical protein GQF42_43865 [Streptomyces broussonetiae]|uniref:Mutator family transposase n=1 Tax=Streptomyces broussonetiae TaxID=2686304 RepID=A0A6I6NCX2_9ACTN|nr:hypothetical protein GQF42_43865 [Streptomyces broussonetiae]
MTAFRARPLDHVRFPYVYLDATYCKARVEHQNVSRAVVIATGITEDGGREVLGVMIGDSETGVFWTEFVHPTGRASSRAVTPMTATTKRRAVSYQADNPPQPMTPKPHHHAPNSHLERDRHPHICTHNVEFKFHSMLS